MNAKAELWHWAVLAFAVVGLVALSRRLTHSAEPVGPQAGVDITALVVLGG